MAVAVDPNLYFAAFSDIRREEKRDIVAILARRVAEHVDLRDPRHVGGERCDLRLARPKSRLPDTTSIAG